MNEQELAEKVVDKMLSRDEFSKWLNVKLLEVKPGFATIEMTVRPEMLNGFAVCHGGIAYSLADSALAFASNSSGFVTVAIENSISYPEKVLAGDTLIAVAVKVSGSNRISIFDVTISKKDDTKVALFRGIVYRTDKKYLEG